MRNLIVKATDGSSVAIITNIKENGFETRIKVNDGEPVTITQRTYPYINNTLELRSHWEEVN